MKYTTVKPFIKWAGRKSQLLDEIGVFLFQKQKIIYLGNLLLKEDESLYRESIGKNILFCCEIVAYHTTDIINTFEIMLQSNKELLKLHIIENDLSGTYVDADDYFYKLSQFPYPLPSNCIKKYDFCKLTPGESKLLMSLIVSSNKTVCIENESFDNQDSNKLHIIDMSKYLSEIQRSNNSVLSILLLSNNNYVVCNQIPISPFNPVEMDRATVCLYDINDEIKSGTIPNIIIECNALETHESLYKQAIRRLKWLKQICSDEEYSKVSIFIIASNLPLKKENYTKLNNKIRILT